VIDHGSTSHIDAMLRAEARGLMPAIETSRRERRRRLSEAAWRRAKLQEILHLHALRHGVDNYSGCRSRGCPNRVIPGSTVGARDVVCTQRRNGPCGPAQLSGCKHSNSVTGQI